MLHLVLLIQSIKAMNYNIQITSHIPGSEKVFQVSDLRRRLINAIQQVLQEESIRYDLLTAQEAYEAFSVIPGVSDQEE